MPGSEAKIGLFTQAITKKYPPSTSDLHALYCIDKDLISFSVHIEGIENPIGEGDAVIKSDHTYLRFIVNLENDSYKYIGTALLEAFLSIIMANNLHKEIRLVSFSFSKDFFKNFGFKTYLSPQQNEFYNNGTEHLMIPSYITRTLFEKFTEIPALTGETLERHCDQIITALEKAVQAAVYAKHFTSDNARDRQTVVEATKLTQANYYQSVSNLYKTKPVPPLFNRVYALAISNPTETCCHNHAGYPQLSEGYKIQAGLIVRQLNRDFLPNHPPYLWISYNQPHLNCLGNISNERVGAPNYQLNWENNWKDVWEEKTIYLTIEKKGLLYRVLDLDHKAQTGRISLEKILANATQTKHSNIRACANTPIETHCIHLNNTHAFYKSTDNNLESIDLTIIIKKLVDGLHFQVLYPNGTTQNGQLSLDKIVSLMQFDHIAHPDQDIFVEISTHKEPTATYYSTLLVPILSHKMAQVVAIGLLVLGTTLAVSGITVGAGAGMAIVGSGILMAGFFPPKKEEKNNTLTPEFFMPQNGL